MGTGVRAWSKLCFFVFFFLRLSCAGVIWGCAYVECEGDVWLRNIRATHAPNQIMLLLSKLVEQRRPRI